MNGDMSDHETMLDLIAVAALGALEAHERTAVSLHLATCEECRTEYAQLREAANSLALVAEATIPAAQSDRMRRRLLSAVEPPAVLAERRARPAFFGWAAGLVAAAAIVFAVITSQHERALRSDLAARDALVASDAARVANEHAGKADAKASLAGAKARLADANARLADVKARLADANARLGAERAEIADLAAPDAERYSVAGGTIVRRAEHIYVALARLPQLPRGKVYQAWTVSKGSASVKPSITFSPTAGEPAVVRLPGAARRFVAVAVSVEPVGGSKAPTSKPIFLRKLG